MFTSRLKSRTGRDRSEVPRRVVFLVTSTGGRGQVLLDTLMLEEMMMVAFDNADRAAVYTVKAARSSAAVDTAVRWQGGGAAVCEFGQVMLTRRSAVLLSDHWVM